MGNNRKIRLTALAALFVIVFSLLYFHKDLIQSYNLHTLLNEDLDGRLVPHRINSIDQLQSLYDKNIRSFEVDLYFQRDTSSGRFHVGHNKDKLTGLVLDRYFDVIDGRPLKKMWMDLKNVTADNVQPIVNELNRLDSLYDIRDIAIVESSYPSDEIKMISDAGYHLSYYLPTDRILGMIENAQTDSLRAKADRLRAQADGRHVSALSFDLRLYPFVKEYLEPNIPDSIVYHTWGAVKLWEWGTMERLEDSPYFKDNRVKTILYRVW